MLSKEELNGFGIDNEEMQGKIIGHVDSKLSEISRSNQDEVSKAVGKAYSNIELTLHELTGVEKPEGVKASEYAKLAFDHITNSSNTKLKDLQSKIESGTISEDVIKENQSYKDQIASFSETIKAKEAEWTNKLNEKESEYISYKKDISFKNAFPKFSEDANQYEVNHHIAEVKKALNEEYDLDWDDKGNFTATKDYTTKLVSDIINENENIKKLIDVPRSQKGIGAEQTKDDSNKGLKLDGLTDEQKILTVRKHISETLGIDRMSPEYSKVFAELIKKV